MDTYKTIQFRLNAADYARIQQIKQASGLSYRDLFMQALGLEPKTPEKHRPTMVELPETAAFLVAAQQRGELFMFPDQPEFLLIQIEIDETRLPDFELIETHLLGAYESADAALSAYCQQGLQLAEMRQTVLLHKANPDYLGFTPSADHWYYPAHIVLEIYPRIMNAFGDFDYYEGLLSQFYLAQD